MADRTISIDITANDYATRVFRNVGHGVSTFTGAVYSGVESANSALRRYNNYMRGFNSVVTRAMITAGRAVYNFTTDSIKQFAELEKQHAHTMGVLSANYDFNWNGNNTPEQHINMQRFYTNSEALKEQAYQYGSVGPTGKGSLYNPIEVSQAHEALVRAGISDEDILNTDVLATVMKFAGGNGLSIDDAVAYGVQIGAQFHKDPADWGPMFDQITNAANMAPIDVTDVMNSLKMSGNMAAGYDVPLSDVLSAIVIMGKSGLKGTQAGSGISAIFARAMNPTGITTASKAPNEHVEEVYNNFKAKVIDDTGTFTGLGNFTDELQATLDSLTDEEKAWFNKKMFGMFQTKAALALGREPTDGEATFAMIADAIENNSGGVNDALYDLILESSGGQIEALHNVWDSTKMRFGDAISPLTKEVTKQLIGGLTTKNFDIDVEALQTALDEAVERTNEQFGERIGDLVGDLGQVGIDASQVLGAEAPLLASSGSALLQLFSGDFSGAWQTFQDGLDDTNEQIEKLPPELQGTAEGLRNMILLFEGLFALNIVTKIGEMVTSLGMLLGGIGGFVIKLIRGNHNISANSTVTSTNSVVNASTISNMTVGTIANMTATTITNMLVQSVATFMAQTTTMTVTAGTVIVNGGFGSGFGSGGYGVGGGGPMLPGGGPLTALGNGMAQGTGFMIGAGATGSGLMLGGRMFMNALGAGAGSSMAALPSATAPLALPAGSATAGAGATGASIGGMLLKGLGVAGMTVGIASMLTTHAGYVGNIKDFENMYAEATSKGLTGADEIRAYAGAWSDEMYEAMRQAWNNYTGDMDYAEFMKDYGNTHYTSEHAENPSPAFVEGAKLGNDFVYFEDWVDSYQRMLSFANSAEGLQKFYDAINNQLADGGKINEEFLKGFFNDNNLEMRGGYGQAMVEMMMANMFDGGDKYSRPGHYSGEFADSSLNEFIKSHVNDTLDWSQFGTVSQVLAALNGALENMEYVPNSDSVYRNVATGEKYQLTDDGRLVAWDEAAQGITTAADIINTAADNMNASARQLAGQLISSGAIDILDLGKGPLSTEGAIDYLTSQLTGNAGKFDDPMRFTDPLGMMSGKNAMNRFNSKVTGNAGSANTSTDTILGNIDSDLDALVTAAANNITDEGLRNAFLAGMADYEGALSGSITGLNNNVISLQDAVSTLSKSPGWVLELGQGPLSSEGAYNYVMQQLASGSAANSQLLQSIQNGISALDPSLTVDITNSAPIVNVDVNVKVDSTGRVISKQVLQGFGNIDNWWYRSSQRYGTTKRIER